MVLLAGCLPMVVAHGVCSRGSFGPHVPSAVRLSLYRLSSVLLFSSCRSFMGSASFSARFSLSCPLRFFFVAVDMCVRHVLVGGWSDQSTRRLTNIASQQPAKHSNNDNDSKVR